MQTAEFWNNTISESASACDADNWVILSTDEQNIGSFLNIMMYLVIGSSALSSRVFQAAGPGAIVPPFIIHSKRCSSFRTGGVDGIRP